MTLPTPEPTRSTGSEGLLTWRHPATLSRTRNVLWTAPTTLVQALLPFLFIPIYVRLLGAEAYGLVVLNASILTALLFADRLFSLVIISEFGKDNGTVGSEPRMGQLLRTFEPLVFGVAVLIVIAVMVTTPFLVSGWRDSIGLQGADLSKATLLMGLAIGAQWPGFLYSAGLVGLQRHMLLTIVKLSGLLAQHLGGVALLYLVEPSVLLLLVWQAFVFIATSLVMRMVLWRVMPGEARKAHARISLLGDVWQVAIGGVFLGLGASMIAQLDKLIVAQQLKPDVFTGYALTFMAVYAAYGVVSSSIGPAMQPHFAGLIAAKDEAMLRDNYHRWSQTFVLCLAPVAGVLIFFPSPIIHIWLGTGTPLGAMIAGLMPIAALAGFVAALLASPFNLQLAAGWNRLVIACHCINIILMLAFLPWTISTYGPHGGAWFVLGVFVVYYVIMGPLLHRKISVGPYWQWLLNDIVLPVAASLAVFWFVSRVSGPTSSLWAQWISAIIASMLCVAILLGVLPEARKQVRASVGHLLGPTQSSS